MCGTSVHINESTVGVVQVFILMSPLCVVQVFILMSPLCVWYKCSY